MKTYITLLHMFLLLQEMSNNDIKICPLPSSSCTFMTHSTHLCTIQICRNLNENNSPHQNKKALSPFYHKKYF